MSSNSYEDLRKRKLVVHSRSRGVHKGTRTSNAFGISFDFSDFRQYEIGDDLRLIDWNAYARTEKLYIKRFLDEQEISVAVYLDCTTSMTCDEKKWAFAKQLAALFGFITLSNDDRFTFLPVGGPLNFPPISRKGVSFSQKIVEQINDYPLQEEKLVNFPENLEKKFLPRNDLSIIITDGWESIDQFATLFKRISPRSKEIRFLHVLGKDEIDPPYRNDIKLIDSEKETGIQVTMSKRMIDLYKGKLDEHMKRLSELCRRYKITYLQVHSGENVRKFFLTNV